MSAVDLHSGKRVVVLLGTQHPLQEAATHLSSEAIARFRARLLQLSREHQVTAIGEEMSIERMHDWDHKRLFRHSVAHDVATELGITHCYCDPDTEERKMLAITTGDPQHYGRREDEWLRRISELGQWPLLFLCGLDHIHTFAARLKEAGTTVHAVPEFRIPADI